MRTKQHFFPSWSKDAFFALLFLIVVSYISYLSAVKSGYNWQWDRTWSYFFTYDHGIQFGELIRVGLWNTVKISFFALILSILIGLFTAFLRLSGGKFTRFCIISLVQVVRNTPLMVQLLAFYMLLPAKWNIPASHIAILALGLFEGVYLSEIFRAGITNIPKGQWDAALSLGLPLSVIWSRIILPQAIRSVLPPCVNQCVTLIKDSSLASVIAVSELSQLAGLLASDTFLTFEIWFPVAAIYMAIALVLSFFAKCLERYLQENQNVV